MAQGCKALPQDIQSMVLVIDSNMPDLILTVNYTVHYVVIATFSFAEGTVNDFFFLQKSYFIASRLSLFN